MGTLAMFHNLKNDAGQSIDPAARVLGGSVVLLAVIVFLTACGQSSTPEADKLVPRTVTVSLPTSQPTVAPSPANTRVMPAPEFTPVPTLPMTPTLTPIPDETRGLVVEIIAGDTIAVVMEGDPPSRAYEVKYLGVDSPPNTPDNPWGVVAHETNRKLTNLKVVRLVRDQTDTDDEGRLLRYVYVGDKLMSVALAEQGLARANVVEPDTRFKQEIEAAESQARNGRLGLWGQLPTPTPADRQPGPAESEGEIPPQTTLTITITLTPEATEELSTEETPVSDTGSGETATTASN